MTTPAEVLRSMFEHHLWATEVLIDHLERLPAQQLDASVPERVDRRLGLLGPAAPRDVGSMDPGDELVDVVDEENEVVGVVPRRTLRAENLWHRCTYVFVLNSAGELYVHRRTDTKDVYPGFYDVVAGGVNAAGESFDECARRELEEELGVAAEPTFRFLHRYDGPGGRVWGGAYDVVWDGPIVWQPSEVVWGAFVPFDEMDEMIAREPFCPDGLEVFERWRAESQPS